MDEAQTTQIRLGLLGLGREHLDLMPALYRDPRATVVWVYGGRAAATVARLGSLFSYPAIERLDADRLAQADLIIRPAAEAPEWQEELPATVRAITDAELAALYTGNGFRWEAIAWPTAAEEARPGAEPARPAPLEPATIARPDRQAEGSLAVGAAPERHAEEELPQRLPAWFAQLCRADGLAGWFLKRLAREAQPAYPTCLVLLTPGGGCLDIYGEGLDGGRARRGRSRRCLNRLLKPAAGTGESRPQVLQAVADEVSADCGLPAGPIHLLWFGLRDQFQAVVLVAAGETGQPALRAWMEAAAAFLQRESRSLTTLLDLALVGQQARDWQRLRGVLRRLNRGGRAGDAATGQGGV